MDQELAAARLTDPPFSIFLQQFSIRYAQVVRWKKITIIGVGLLGGSLGLAIRKHRLAGEVAGFVRRAASVRECRRLGAVDYATRNLNRAVEEADLIVLCTPLAQMHSLATQMLPALKPGAVVTDVGSVKAGVNRELEPLVERVGARFVGSHPMAGAEKNGVAAARADLFVKAVCVLTPTLATDRAALQRVEQFWKALGARVLKMPPAEHDLLVSRSSHLPHLVAATLASYVLDPRFPKHQAVLCASGFRDATRIASGSPEMWRDIALANRHNLGCVLDEFVRHLQKVRTLLRDQTLQERPRAAAGLKLEAFLAAAKQRRDGWRSQAASPSPE